LLEELTEATMRRAWPGTRPAERSRIVLAALIQQRHWEEALRTVSEQCRAEGFDTEKLLDEYLHAAGVSPVVDAQEANEIARSAAEYFKVVDQLEGFNLGKMCLEALMEARMRAVEEFAEREVIDFKEAAALLGGNSGSTPMSFRVSWRRIGGTSSAGPSPSTCSSPSSGEKSRREERPRGEREEKLRRRARPGLA